MAAAQGIGFRACFSFGDGIYGEKRDAKVENSAILTGMKTRAENAESLSGLADYAENHSLAGRDLIAFGSAPGLHFILDMPPGISHCWPDLDTYPAAQMKEELDYDASSHPMTYFRSIDYDYDDFSVRLHYFIIRDPNPALELREHIGAQWHALDDLEGLNWAGADLKLVNILRTEPSFLLMNGGN